MLVCARSLGLGDATMSAAGGKDPSHRHQFWEEGLIDSFDSFECGPDRQTDQQTNKQKVSHGHSRFNRHSHKLNAEER